MEVPSKYRWLWFAHLRLVAILEVEAAEEVEMAVNQMRYTTTYEKIFEPHKWDVIVRVLK